MSSINLCNVPGPPHVLTNSAKSYKNFVAIRKVVDDFLIIGRKKNIESFVKSLCQRFYVGRYHIDETTFCNGTRISRQGDGSVTYNMEEYLGSINYYLEICTTRRKEQRCKCLEAKLNKCLQLTGSFNWMGHDVLPQAAFAVSPLEKAIGILSFFYLITANKALQEIRTLKPKAVLCSANQREKPAYFAFCDASQGSSSYGKTGYISEL